ncbi:hypothetical protein I6E10_13165 [Phocaeicola barnesiae]|uniref:hypothetical protein n=1 Tax=Phocaeicola barnesiae TaxID=376804 RepID=UPI001F1B7DE3|nr:hypothetical protein [Phocaeicola barnesiae]MCF2599633.1 hypothetical protein [Phocaeicola barnesiae]
MGVINKTTAEINTLLDKVEGMPEEGVVGKTPVLETGSTTTLNPGQKATSQIVANGTDTSGNPKYKINFGIPRGYDGSSTGGGGIADSVQWSNVLNKPTWVNSSTKPTYTATEVGALPASTTIPSRTSQLTNDSNYVTSFSLKTINGQSIVGAGNIEISGTGSGIADAPSDGKIYGRKNGAWASITSSIGGSVDISDILQRITQLAGIGGTCTDEDYNTLKGYADNGIVTYMKTDGSSTIVEVKNLGGNIQTTYNFESVSSITVEAINVSPFKQVTFSQKNILQDTNIGPGRLGMYTKPASYSAISKEDSISTAIGKLEAGLSGINASNGVYYLPEDILNVNEESTKEEALSAFGGYEKLEEFLTEVCVNGKQAYIIKRMTGINSGASTNIPVSVDHSSFGSSFVNLKFISNKAVLTPEDTKFVTLFLAYSPSAKSITLLKYRSSYLYGYGLEHKFYTLTSESSSDDISSAISGESGMRQLIKSVNSGDRIYIKGNISTPGRTDLICNSAVESENGDMSLMFTGLGYGLWGVSLGICAISYTKSSNTFSAVVTTI